MSQSIGRPTYIVVFLALLVLLAVTWLAAQVDYEEQVGWSGWGVAVAMAIAIIKTGLVVVYFMHVRYATALTLTVIAAAALWLAILFALTLNDYLTRG